jgi:hypothetical protein
MLRALELVMPLRTFLRDVFFSNVEQHESDTIDIDVVKGGRRLAPFVSSSAAGKAKEKKGYETHTFKIPYIKELITFTAHDLLTRDPGKTVYDMLGSANERAIAKMAKEMQESSNAIDRRIEWMCAQILQTGKVVCKGEGVEQTVDFSLPSDHNITLSGGALWTAASTADPLKNLREWKRILSKKGKNLTDFILSPEAYDNFLSANKISGASGLFNQNQINLGKIDPQQLGNGATYIGRITEIGVDLWMYEEYFSDDTANGTEKPLINAGNVIGISRASNRILHYGAIKDLDCVASVPKFPKAWREENPSAMLGALQSAPLPAAHDIEGIIVAKVA